MYTLHMHFHILKAIHSLATFHAIISNFIPEAQKCEIYSMRHLPFIQAKPSQDERSLCKTKPNIYKRKPTVMRQSWKSFTEQQEQQRPWRKRFRDQHQVGWLRQ
jgi:hypothetical protein